MNMQRHFDAVLLGSIELFCLAAEHGSFTAAAHAAGVTPAAVSRSISRLEVRLGVRLFTRTTRRIRLTEGGRAYFASCHRALGDLVEAEREVTGHQAAPTGLIRISAPTTYGHHRLLPRLGAFRVRYPDVHFDVHLGNRNVDFVEEGFDLAVRVREQPDSTLVVRKLEDAELVLVASPSYLAQKGSPTTLDALDTHECIQFELPSSGRTIPWLFRSGGRDIERVTRGGYVCSDDVLGGVTLARSGAGIFQAYRFVVERDLREGALVEILRDHGGRARPFNLLHPHAKHMPRRVRTFVDFLFAR